MRILLLGGTGEARALAERLHPDVDVISSLAGRVPDPALPVGEVRIGGFGGEDAMAAWLKEHRVDAVIDATHPFAAAITDRAARVCGRLGLPHLVLERPAWDPGDALVATTVSEAADIVERQSFSRVFLTSGRSTVAAFRRSNAWFLVRLVTAADPAALPPRATVVLSRGPYRYDAELALLRQHRIDVLVTKNSGGQMTRAKLDAAAVAGVPVVMVARPALPEGVARVSTVSEAADWLLAR